MSVVTVGDFDGVHLGHRALLRDVASFADSQKIPSIAVTFDRNTKSFLRQTDPYYLTDFEEKKSLILSEGIGHVCNVPFDDAFSKMSPQAFLTLLKERYGCTHLFGGADFRFGCGGEGALTDGACVEGIVQHVVSLKTDLVKISSSTIRTALTDGLIERANSWLGYPYFVSGTVVEGKHLGRTIGFPTVNLASPMQKVLPKNGVYITETTVDGTAYRSVTNVGVRPSVQDGDFRNIETHLLEARGDFYGKTITVRFLSRLRDEIRFADLGALMQQLRIDRDAAFSWRNPG
ncbi:MAG: riboflavin biosynthesis protein RibF [Clostridia bacterium]|nr:riboflavin biosynthesis protein RibF [Clostridia bacterium]